MNSVKFVPVFVKRDGTHRRPFKPQETQADGESLRRSLSQTAKEIAAKEGKEPEGEWKLFRVTETWEELP